MPQLRLPTGFAQQIRGGVTPAVVVGTDVTGLTVARALARHGVPVLGVDEKRRGYVSYSSAFHFVPCPDFFGHGLIRGLDALADQLPDPAMLVLTMDESVKVIGQSGQHLRERFRFDFPEAEVVDRLMNKQAFTEYALGQGLPLPETACCESEEDVRRAATRFQYPVIMKPRLKNLEARTHAPKKTFLCRDPEALLDDYRLIAQWEPEVLVQEFIPGGDGEIYFSFHYFDGKGNDVASFEGRKVRQYIPDCGVTASAVGVPVPQVVELSRQILAEAGCRGFCSVEYKRDARTGRFYIMEPTVGRVDLQLGVAMANDADIVSRVYFHLMDRPYPVLEHPTHDVIWIRARADLRAARFYIRRGDITLRDYLRSIRGPRYFAVWGRPDRGLVFGWLRVTVVRALKLPVRIGRRMVRASRHLIPALR